MAGVLQRLKARDRAAAIIKLYRDNGDQRPPSEMGFEMARRLPDGTEETQVVIVQDLLDEAAQLEPLASHCTNCPANRLRSPFGCYDHINYPISRAAELWLLKQLPTPDDPLIFLLLSHTMVDFNFSGDQVYAMRQRPGIIFETGERFGKTLEETQITSDQVFELLFLNGALQPPHAALLMLFFGAIPRDMDAGQLMELTIYTGSTLNAHPDVPFTLRPDPTHYDSIRSFKAFFESLYVAYRLTVPLVLDV